MPSIHRVTLLLVVFCLSIVALPFAYAEKVSEPEKIDINSADAWTLDRLHGIGPKKAEAIIKYRKENGLFKTIYELDKVPGIGEKTILKNMDKMIVILPEQPEQPSEAEASQTGDSTGSTQTQTTSPVTDNAANQTQTQDAPATDNAANQSQTQEATPATDNTAETPAVTEKQASQSAD